MIDSAKSNRPNATAGTVSLKDIENQSIPNISSSTRFGNPIVHKRERQTLKSHIELSGVKTDRSQVLLLTLSDGNQLKIILSKCVIGSPSVVALHEPTQSLDADTMRGIFYHLSDFTRRGALIIMSSIEYEDLAHLCTRVHVMSGGRIVRTLERGELTPHDLAVAVYER